MLPRICCQAGASYSSSPSADKSPLSFARLVSLPPKYSHIHPRRTLAILHQSCHHITSPLGSSAASNLRIQLQTDARYQAFVPRSKERGVLGYRMRVADVADVLRGKIWAYQDEQRRRSKRQKDLADIMRLVEATPTLEKSLPPEMRKELE